MTMTATRSVSVLFATPIHGPAVVQFFARFADAIRESTVSEETLCPSGMRAAVARREMLIATDGERIVAAARIYRQKKSASISLYQFAVDEQYRGRRVLHDLLRLALPKEVRAICCKSSPIESYFRKTGWCRTESNANRSVWLLSSTDAHA